MDGPRFDQWAKNLVTRTNRRRVLGGALASVLAGMLGVPATAVRRKHSAARKTQKQRQRLRKEQAAGGACAAFCSKVPAGPERGKCQEACVHGTSGGLFDQCGGEVARLCTDATGAVACCPQNEACCGRACLDVQTDVRNCGSCGARCRINEQCIGGKCYCDTDLGSCPTGVTCCLNAAGEAQCLCAATGSFVNLSTCTVISIPECPTQTIPCVAPVGTACGGKGSQACCPIEMTCTAAGDCLQ